MIKTDRKTKPSRDIFAVIGLLAVFAFILWRCRYGFANLDESFYLAVPYRILQGDALFLDEWHLSQMSSVLLYPFVRIYVGITGSTVGILLAFRYLFSCLWLFTALFVFFRTKEINRTGALAASVSFLIFAPYGIMGVSYNSMAISGLILCFVILLTAKTHLRFQWTVSGILLAVSVLCCPYLIFLYAAYLITVILLRKKQTYPVLQSKTFAFVTLGAVLTAILFFAFVFSRIGIKDMLASLPNILNDPEHAFRTQMLLTFFYCILNSCGTLSYICFGAYFVLYLLMWKDKTKEHGILYFIICILVTAVYESGLIVRDTNISLVMFPLNMLGIAAMLLSGSGTVKKLFGTFWIPGMIYAYCISLSSNQRFHAVATASAVPLIASILMICVYLAENGGWKKGRAGIRLATGMIAVFLGLQISAETVIRYETVFWDDSPVSEQTEEIGFGCEKGLLVSGHAYREYEPVYRDMESINNNGQISSVLILPGNSWAYLDCWKKTDASCSPGTWVEDPDTELSRIREYYGINPKKSGPDAVYYGPVPENGKKWQDTSVLSAIRGTFAYGFRETEGRGGVIFTRN